MALTRDERERFRTCVHTASRPLVFYDDDADGLASYLLIHRANPDTIGIRAARGPELDLEFARKITENQPDLVIVLDKPRADKRFFLEHRTPSIWLDHHDPHTQDPRGWNIPHLTYLNPRIHNTRDARPTSYWVWRALGGPLWIAATGTMADWHDSLLQQFAQAHPTLAPTRHTVQDALYHSPLGTLVRVFNFVLKGKSGDIRKCVGTLTRIETPEEILHQTTPRGRFLWKHYVPILHEYHNQRAQALRARTRDGALVHVFENLRISLVAEVANELLITRNAPVIIVGRRVGEDIKFSMRSMTVDLPPLVERALHDVHGYGGGHKEACGGSIRADDWERFVAGIRAHTRHGAKTRQTSQQRGARTSAADRRRLPAS